jgi:hypothetical protein
VFVIDEAAYGSYTWNGTAYNHVTISDVDLVDGNNTVELTCVSGGAGYEELSETFLLFGDPAVALKVPLPR